MLLGCGGNDTSSLINDESARTSGADVDPQKRHCRFARSGAIIFVPCTLTTGILPRVCRITSAHGIFHACPSGSLPGAFALIQSLRCGACLESGFVILG